MSADAYPNNKNPFTPIECNGCRLIQIGPRCGRDGARLRTLESSGFFKPPVRSDSCMDAGRPGDDVAMVSR